MEIREAIEREIFLRISKEELKKLLNGRHVSILAYHGPGRVALHINHPEEEKYLKEPIFQSVKDRKKTSKEKCNEDEENDYWDEERDQEDECDERDECDEENIHQLYQNHINQLKKVIKESMPQEQFEKIVKKFLAELKN